MVLRSISLPYEKLHVRVGAPALRLLQGWGVECFLNREPAGQGVGRALCWWTSVAPEVKNTDHARHKEEQMVLLGVSFPLQDLPLDGFTSYQPSY